MSGGGSGHAVALSSAASSGGGGGGSGDGKQQMNVSSPLKDSKLSELLRCIICFSRVHEPRLCPACSKMCCRSCITKWLTEQRLQCPYCRHELSVAKLVNVRWVGDMYAEIERLETVTSTAITVTGGKVPVVSVSGGGGGGKNRSSPARAANSSGGGGGGVGSGALAEDECIEHGAVLTYYCVTCTQPVCSDCALMSDRHRTHRFERLATVYNQSATQVSVALNGAAVRERLSALTAVEAAIEAEIRAIKYAKDERTIELQHAMAEMEQRLTAQLRSKLLVLLGQKSDVLKAAHALESLVRDVSTQLNPAQCSQSSLIERAPALLARIRDAVPPLPSAAAGAGDVADPALQLLTSRQSVSAEFTSELTPSFESAVFVVSDFASYRERDELMYSPPLLVRDTGMTWRLKLYPNGNGVARGTFLSVFVELSTVPVVPSASAANNASADAADHTDRKHSSLPLPLPLPSASVPTLAAAGAAAPAVIDKYEYRIELINHFPAAGGGGADGAARHNNIARVYSSTFTPGECWGYNKFFRIDSLEESGFLTPPLPDDAAAAGGGGALHFRFSVRPLTYAAHCRDQARYITFLQQQQHTHTSGAAAVAVSGAPTPTVAVNSEQPRPSSAVDDEKQPYTPTASTSRAVLGSGGGGGGAGGGRFCPLPVLGSTSVTKPVIDLFPAPSRSPPPPPQPQLDSKQSTAAAAAEPSAASAPVYVSRFRPPVVLTRAAAAAVAAPVPTVLGDEASGVPFDAVMREQERLLSQFQRPHASRSNGSDRLFAPRMPAQPPRIDPSELTPSPVPSPARPSDAADYESSVDEAEESAALAALERELQYQRSQHSDDASAVVDESEAARAQAAAAAVVAAVQHTAAATIRFAGGAHSPPSQPIPPPPPPPVSESDPVAAELLSPPNWDHVRELQALSARVVQEAEAAGISVSDSDDESESILTTARAVGLHSQPAPIVVSATPTPVSNHTDLKHTSATNTGSHSHRPTTVTGGTNGANGSYRYSDDSFGARPRKPSAPPVSAAPPPVPTATATAATIAGPRAVSKSAAATARALRHPLFGMRVSAAAAVVTASSRSAVVPPPPPHPPALVQPVVTRGHSNGAGDVKSPVGSELLSATSSTDDADGTSSGNDAAAGGDEDEDDSDDDGGPSAVLYQNKPTPIGYIPNRPPSPKPAVSPSAATVAANAAASGPAQSPA